MRIWPLSVALAWLAGSGCNGHVGVYPNAGTGGTSAASTAAATTGGGPSTGSGPSPIGLNGGKLDALSFAIVGDTRPAVPEDTKAYPTKVITQIYADIQQANPRPAFAVATGDYMFAYDGSGASAAQLKLYLQARSQFVNPLFPALGNHECTSAVDSNCGPGNPDGTPSNYTDFMSMMLKGISDKPYYSIEIDDTAGKWTSKFVFVAANAWDDAQAVWLESALSKPTTYTFVVRHESTVAYQAPGVKPSDAIVAKHPLTLMLCGHTHTYVWKPTKHQLVVGNGGAPLTSTSNYGYVLARQRGDGGIEFSEYDYDTNAINESFVLAPDGSIAK